MKQQPIFAPARNPLSIRVHPRTNTAWLLVRVSKVTDEAIAEGTYVDLETITEMRQLWEKMRDMGMTAHHVWEVDRDRAKTLAFHITDRDGTATAQRDRETDNG